MNRSLQLFWVDAFTDRTFSGNPAAVVPLESWPDDGLLQRIANENGLSETAFFVRTGAQAANLRWFTPEVEVDLCGHATLATAFVLGTQLGQELWPVVFETRSGPLYVRRRADLIELDFPARPAAPVEAPPELARALGLTPAEVRRSSKMWLCAYRDASEVRDLTPDIGALSRISPGRFIPTAPGEDCDFVSRFFAPDAGVAEDPVTGSSHCTLAPYWAERLGKTRLHARQLSRRGGELWCELTGERVILAGRGTLYLKGTITP